MKKSHQYTVELRVWGKDLDPKRVTEDTGLVPCQTRARGDRLGSRAFDQAMWAFNGQGSAPTKDWDSLEEGLTFVLDTVGDSQSAFTRLASQFKVVWWCGHFQSSFDGGPELSPELLRKLATFGAALFVDNYFSPPGSEDRTEG
jgi:Domain of unknown function (DUF4279)